jgi:hypothetical protein
MNDVGMLIVGFVIGFSVMKLTVFLVNKIGAKK